MTIHATRTQNEKAVEKLDTTDMAGGVLPRDLFEDWYQKVVDSATMLEGPARRTSRGRRWTCPHQRRRAHATRRRRKRG